MGLYSKDLLHFEGSPGLMRRYSMGMGVQGFPLTIAFYKITEIVRVI